MKKFFSKVQWNDKGYVPVIIQDAASSRVLTLCYMTEEALAKSVEEGKIYVFRRSKNKLMLKGETSGHIQIIREMYIDCEGKSLLCKVEQKVAGCHAGYFSCYFSKIDKDGNTQIIDEKVFDPKEVYR